MPTRYLKPGVRDSEAIDRLSPLAETLFYRLLVTVDDFGRGDARPAMVKAQCYPIKESVTPSKCAQLLDELSKCGLIVVYQADGKTCLQMLKWDNKPRAAESMFPAPADTCIQTYADANIPRTVLPVTVTVTGTKTETKTETGTVVGGVKRRTQIPAEFYPDETGIRKAEERGVSVAVELQKFADYHKGKGSVMADWQAAWRTWVGNVKPAGETIYQKAKREQMMRDFPNLFPQTMEVDNGPAALLG